MNLYKNKNWLYQKYATEKRSGLQIAKEAGSNSGTIYQWLRRFNIPVRKRNEMQAGRHHSEASKRKIGMAHKGKNYGFVGQNHPCWKGGKVILPDGYIIIKKPDHPHVHKNGYVLEHRLVMEKHLGRYLKPKEVVHHKDGNKGNNDISNLCLTIREKHKIGYGRGYKNGYSVGFVTAFLLFLMLKKYEEGK